MSWSKDYDVNGAQDMYGLESHPACWGCNLKECGNVSPFMVVSYHEHFDGVSPTQPSFLPEFQGESYNPWGVPQGGCSFNMGPDFVNVFYRHNIAERVTMVSLHMLYCGTNWGGLATNWPAHLMTTWYLLARVDRSDKDTTRLSSSECSSGPQKSYFTKLDRITSSTSFTTNALISATGLRNPDTKAAFYVTRHATSSAETKDGFKLRISTLRGNLTVPATSGKNIVSNERDSKIVVTYFGFGTKALLYSTAEVLSSTIIDGTERLALWLPQGESGEFATKGGCLAQSRRWNRAYFHNHQLERPSRIVHPDRCCHHSSAGRCLYPPRPTHDSMEILGASPYCEFVLAWVQLYVNEYQYGKFVQQVGNQIAFPVSPGVLNFRGNNTLGLTVWSQSVSGAKIDLSWNVLGVYDGAWDPAFDANYLQPEWNKQRLGYAQRL